MKIGSFLKKYGSIPNFILVITLGLILTNSFYLFVKIMVNIQNRDVEILEPGTQFISFKEKLKNVTRIGYLTDKDFSPENNDGFFLQAQYALAPIIVELNDPSHKFNIIDYKTVPQIAQVMRQLKAVRVTHNEYGQALIVRPNYK